MRPPGRPKSQARRLDAQRLEELIAAGRVAEAETTAARLLRHNATHVYGAAGLARCALARGDLETALRWAERGARFAPNDIALKAFFAALLIAAGRSAEVPPLLAAAVDKAAVPTAAIALGQALARLGAVDRLLPLIVRELHRFPVSVAPLLGDLADHAVLTGQVAGWAAADVGLRVVGALASDAPDAPPSDQGGTIRIESSRHAPLLIMNRVSFLRQYGQQDGAGLVRFVLPVDPDLEGRPLSITLDGVPLLGGPLHPRRHAAVEGSVLLDDAPGGAAEAVLSGWAWCPGDPPQSVTVQVTDEVGRSVTVTADRPLQGARAQGVEDGRYGFLIDPIAAGLSPGRLHVTAGPGSTPLAGSPLPWPGSGGGERRPAPVGPRPLRPVRTGHPSFTGASSVVDIVIPVYHGREETMACLRSVLAADDATPREVVVIDDASPDADLVGDLTALAEEGRITLLRNPGNLGFPATVNRGLALHPDRDAVLLNADTLVAGNWLERLRAAARSAPDVGTVTPLSNDATILSYPSGADRPLPPSLAETAAFDRLARTVNAGLRVDLPTAVGFCVYIRRDCLEETGSFEEWLFGRGYGEENDFCLRAHRLGWRHLGAADVFVAHVGGRSFGRQKAILATRNSHLLERLHPGYDALVQDFIAADPLMAARRRLDLARWAEGAETARGPAVLLVTLAGRGGVARFIEERAGALRAQGWRVLRLVPETTGGENEGDEDDEEEDEDNEEGSSSHSSSTAPSLPSERRCRIEVMDRPDLRDLVFRTRAEFGELAEALRLAGTVAVEIHHLLEHDAAVLNLAGRLGVPYDLTIHDYGLICPRLSLVDKDGRYCGEPDLAACERCTADPDDRADPELTVGALRRRTRTLAAAARRVTVPTRDVATRLLRHIAPRPIEVRSWEDVAPPSTRPPRHRNGRRWRVCTIGAVGIQKGYEVLLACARDAAARSLPLEFVVVGFSEDDPPLFETGHGFVTGRFSEEEAVGLVRAQRADIAFLPSISPETWCYALSTAWKAELEVVAFDLGALSERIRQNGGGYLLPPLLEAATINDALLGILDAHTPHGVAIGQSSSFRSDYKPSIPGAASDGPNACCSIFQSRGGSSMIGSVASAEAQQPTQIKATAQTLSLLPGFYSLIVTSGGGMAAAGEFPLPSVQLAASPNNHPGTTVEMIGSVPGNWLSKQGDTIIIKVSGGAAALILSSYKHVERQNALLSLQFARIDDTPAASASAAPQAAPAMASAPVQSTQAPAAPPAARPRTEILAHIQRQGDLRFADSNWAGAVGQRLWIEAFSITPVDGITPEDIEYKGLTANGWETPWISGGGMCGSRGLGTPLVGFSIRLRGAAAERFDCVYEGAFVSGYRSPAGQNGSPCRSDAIGDALEGFLLRFVEKQAGAAQPRSS